MLDANDPLYSVNGVFNAIFVHGDMLGDAMFYGQGAGKLPTATRWWATWWRQCAIPTTAI